MVFIPVFLFSALLLANCLHAVKIFGNETVSTVYSTEWVRDIAEDEYICGNFLILKSTQIITTDFVEYQTLYQTLTDPALTRLLQPSANQLLFPAEHGRCILSLDRATNHVETYAGSCESWSSQTVTGHRLSVRFWKLYDLIMIEKSLLLAVDYGSKTLIYINMTSEQVSVAESGGYLAENHPARAVQHPINSPIVYVLTRYNGTILELNLTSHQQKIVAKGNSTADGDLSTAGFTEILEDLNFVNNNTAMLVTDGHAGLRFIDLVENTLTTLCRYGGAQDEGVLSKNCRFAYPSGMVEAGGQVYIAHHSGISFIAMQTLTVAKITRSEAACKASFKKDYCIRVEYSRSVQTPTEMRCAILCWSSETCAGFQFNSGRCCHFTAYIRGQSDGDTCFVYISS